MKLVKNSKAVTTINTRGGQSKVYGVITKVDGDKCTMNTIASKTRTCKIEATKAIPAAEYKAVVKAYEADQAKKNAPSKREISQTIFNANKDEKRSVVVTLFVKAGLTPNGAATYYQKFKSGAWTPSKAA